MGSEGKSAVCCMCGDHGLLPELFRCAACSVRSQHTYCTDRYPKAEAYGTCNWCLRIGQSAATGAASPSSPSSSTVKPVAIRPAPAAHCSGSVPQPVNKVVAARGDFSAELNKPIKKQQRRRKLLLRRSASDLGSGRGVAGPPSSPGPGVVARGRPRVRRYKLLEEVIDQQLSFTI